MNDTTAKSSAEVFVAAFTDFWVSPCPQRLPELLNDDVRLIQPLAPPTTGILAAQRHFERFCRRLPGLPADVDSCCGDGDLVFNEFTLHARLGRDKLHCPNVNRLILRDSKAAERATYFDPLAVIPTLLRHPSVMWNWLR